MKIKIIACVCMVFSGKLYGMESKIKLQTGAVSPEKKAGVNSSPAPQTKKTLEEILYLLYVDKVNSRDVAVREMVRNAFLAESEELSKAFRRTGLATQFWSYGLDDNHRLEITGQNTIRQRPVANADQHPNPKQV